MQSEVNQEENLNRIITVPNLLSFFRLCLIPVIIWSYCVKKNPLLAGEILLLSGLTDLADGYVSICKTLWLSFDKVEYPGGGELHIYQPLGKIVAIFHNVFIKKRTIFFYKI